MISREGPYPVLRGAMIARNASVADLAYWIHKTQMTAGNKLSGKYEFSVDEAIAIKQGLQSEEKIEILFKR